MCQIHECIIHTWVCINTLILTEKHFWEPGFTSEQPNTDVLCCKHWTFNLSFSGRSSCSSSLFPQQINDHVCWLWQRQSKQVMKVQYGWYWSGRVVVGTLMWVTGDLFSPLWLLRTQRHRVHFVHVLLEPCGSDPVLKTCRCTGESELPVCVNVSVGGSVITDNELLWLDQYLELVQQNLDSHLS